MGIISTFACDNQECKKLKRPGDSWVIAYHLGESIAFEMMEGNEEKIEKTVGKLSLLCSQDCAVKMLQRFLSEHTHNQSIMEDAEKIVVPDTRAATYDEARPHAAYLESEPVVGTRTTEGFHPQGEKTKI